jgi:hypothetical protein
MNPIVPIIGPFHHTDRPQDDDYDRYMLEQAEYDWYHPDDNADTKDATSITENPDY